MGERAVGFYFGPAGSVCEDAYFSVAAAEQGYYFAFIDGYMMEKSPFSFMDYIKQRRRWINGARLLGWATEYPLKYRVVLRALTFFWFLAPLNMPGGIFSLVVRLQ